MTQQTHPAVNLAPLLDAVIEAVREGGALLRAEFLRPDGPRGADSKADVDEEIETLLRNRLLARLPATWHGEETANAPAAAGYGDWCWLVDPHDGTSAFLRGCRGSAVSVALLYQAVPVLGVVYAPLSPDRGDDLIAWAEGCGPVTRNGVAVERRLEGRRLEHGDFVFVSQDAPSRPVTNTMLCLPARFIAMPSIAYRLARVAAGDGVVGVSLSGPCGYDYAAGHALLRGAGGVLVDEAGRDVSYTLDGRSFVGSRCFGGAQQAVRYLASRDWGAIRNGREAKQSPRVRLRWPRVADDALLSRATGVLLGQCIGDSLGSLVEFSSAGDIAQRYPAGVRNLVDGGFWNTIAGQPTDDSELALVLVRMLAGSGRYDDDAIATAYAQWLESGPFDVGNTTANALEAALDAATTGDPVAEAARQAAVGGNPANGSLMRVSPIGVFAAGKPDEAARLARQDSLLTHAHPLCVESCAAYAAAIAAGVAGVSRRGMLDAAQRALSFDIAGNEVRMALDAADRSALPAADGRNQGFVLVALQIAFRQLMHIDSFEEALVEVVGLGGDTDTNAAITGALIGALHGREAIPPRWVLPVLACRPVGGRAKHPRPMDLWPDDVIELAEALL